ncbi:LysR family transcriptional regulator [Vibrio metschnikovii]|uniref:LysR family transcriptional regulator n=1 Tax=Vibrio metschnikovii TaxID=28172 RepID=UPI001644F13D|nr:LysR family transcriptional regulator [Vibrio metschnikovii]MBC3619956.1 LysR family transcriptional regulator [Vibrio metschnikovii]
MHNYKLLPTLYALLETKNLTDAAKKLNVTQPAISKTLKQLREEFQDPLLIRQGQQFILTKRGESLLALLPSVFTQLEQLYQPADCEVHKIQRPFNLALNHFISPDILPQLCREFHQQAPRARLNTTLWQDRALSELAESQVDLLATLSVIVPENLHGKKLASDQYVVCRWSQHIEQNTTLTLDDYFRARHILVSGLHTESLQVDTLFQRYRKKRRIFATLPSIRLAIETMIGTDCLVTLPLHIAAQYAQGHPVTLFPTPYELPQHDYYLLWHAKHHHSLEHRWFREFCYQFFKQDIKDKQDIGYSLLVS